MTRTIKIAALVAFLCLITLPVYGYFRWIQEIPAPNGVAGVSAAAITPVPPYPEKDFVMSEKMWRKSLQAVTSGSPGWYDVEIVRQRAEIEEYAPAMDILAWMYEQGRGLKRDLRRAFTWYERAKLAGHTELNGDPVKIFKRLKPRDKYLARLQLSEDIQRMKPDARNHLKGFESIKLHVLGRQRPPRTYAKKRTRRTVRTR
jgi:hypothetical protein